MSGEFVIALHALIYLKRHKGVISSQALAQNICTNPARVRKVLAKLSKANLILTNKGLKGGYSYDRSLKNINLEQIAQSLNESVVYCHWHSGSIEAQCLISSGMGFVVDNLASSLNEFCMQKLAKIKLENLEEILDKRIVK